MNQCGPVELFALTKVFDNLPDMVAPSRKWLLSTWIGASVMEEHLLKFYLIWINLNVNSHVYWTAQF